MGRARIPTSSPPKRREKRVDNKSAAGSRGRIRSVLSTLSNRFLSLLEKPLDAQEVLIYYATHDKDSQKRKITSNLINVKQKLVI